MNNFSLNFILSVFLLSLSPCMGQLKITSVEPNFGYPGERLNVLIWGQETHFMAGKSVVNFGPDISAEFQVINKESGIAIISINKNAQFGLQAVSVTTNDENARWEHGFEVMEQGANVRLRLEVAPLEVLYLSDINPVNIASAPLLFSVTLFNDNVERDLLLQLQIVSDNSGYLITGHKTLKNVKPGDVKTITNREFENYDMAKTGNEAINIALQSGMLPAGCYTYTIKVFEDQDELAADYYEQIITNPFSDLELLRPGVQFNELPEVIYNNYPMFEWFSSAKTYNISVYEVKLGQNSAKDVCETRPIFQQKDLTENYFLYPHYAEELMAGKTYAWQVKAHIADSRGEQLLPGELFWFKIAASGIAINSLARIKVEPAEIELACGATIQFVTMGYSENEKMVAISPDWRVVPQEGGTISKNGLFVAGDKAMTLAVVASNGDIQEYATVTINQPPEEFCIRIVSPYDDQQISEPTPDILWEVADSCSLEKQTFQITIWPLVTDTLTSEKIYGPVLRSQRVQNKRNLHYITNTRELEDGREYAVQVELLDEADHPVAQSKPVRFLMARNYKIDWELYQTWCEVKRQGKEDTQVTIMTKLRADSLGETERQLIQDIGARVYIKEGPWLQLTIPFSQLNKLANLDFLEDLSLPSLHWLESLKLSKIPKAKYNSIKSQASKIIVAVFDFGFDISSKNPTIAGKKVQFRSFREDGNIRGSNPAETEHGSACASTLAKIIPNADLFLINFNTELEFFQALRFAVNTLKVQIIACSVSWMQAYDHYDGSSPLWRRVDKILNDRTVLVVAAGNFAKSHWEGSFNDNNGDGSHDFVKAQAQPGLNVKNRDGSYQTGNIKELLGLRLTSGTNYNFLLSWDDWTNQRVDLDLRLVDKSYRQLVSPSGKEYKSANRQSKGRFERPVERISKFSPFYPGIHWYYVDIFLKDREKKPDPLPHFELYVYPPPEDSVPAPVNQSSLASGLAGTRSQSVITVGAVSLEYSSQGPTNDGRVRPDFVTQGITQYKNNRCVGTSFAVPRIAAALSMIFTAHSDWSANQAIIFLQKHCATQHNERKDNMQGWGEIDFERLKVALEK